MEHSRSHSNNTTNTKDSHKAGRDRRDRIKIERMGKAKVLLSTKRPAGKTRKGKNGSDKPASKSLAQRQASVGEKRAASMERTRGAASKGRNDISRGGGAMVLARGNKGGHSPKNVEHARGGLSNTEGALREHIPKNMRAGTSVHSNQSKIYDAFVKKCRPESLLSCANMRWVSLMSDPFNAPWGDEGEKDTRPTLYPGNTPPQITKTTRCFTQFSIAIPAGGSAWLTCCGGPGNYASERSGDPDVPIIADITSFPSVAATPVVDGNYVTLGMPRVGFGIGGVGSAPGGWGEGSPGYYQLQGNAPYTTITGANAAPGQLFASHPLSNCIPIMWGSPVTIGNLVVNNQAAFNYRCVAYGVDITPAQAAINLGGTYNAMIVPGVDNRDYVAAPVGSALSYAEMYALPDHVIERADGAIQINWRPSRDDYGFTTPGIVNAAAGASTTSQKYAPNARMWIQIIPPGQVGILDTTSYTVTIVGFYEISGRPVQQIGTVPEPDPQQGADVATAVQNTLTREVTDRRNDVPDAAAVQVMKKIPKVGGVLDSADTMDDAKGIFSTLMEGAKTIAEIGAFLL